MTDVHQIFSHIEGEVNELEALRQGAHASRNRMLAILGAISLGVIPIAVLSGFPGIFVGIGWLVIAGITFSLTAGKRISEYGKQYKRQVVRAVTQALQPDLEYNPAGGISESEFRAARIFNHSIDRYHNEDGFQGRIGETDIRFSEVKAEYKTESRDKNGRTSTTWHTIFDGIFMVADFHKDFKGHYKVLPDVAEKAFGFLGKKLQKFKPFSKNELIYMEDSEFEKHFVVYGTNQVEARYLISPGLMRRILDLKEKWPQDIRLGFVASRLYVAIDHPGDLLEPKLKLEAGDPEQLQRLIDELEMCFSVVEDLNLNTRIWSKE